MHLPSGKKIVFALSVIAAVLAFLGAPSAVAVDDRPKATMVRTIFTLAENTRRVTMCIGKDGFTYEELRQTFVGRSDADLPPFDANLTGTLFARSKLLRNKTTGVGTFSGTAFVVSDTTHTVTVVGKFLGATDGSLGAGGVYEALVTGDPTATRGKLVGNFDITFANADVTSLNGTFGGLGNPQRAAVVIQGACEHDANDTREEVD